METRTICRRDYKTDAEYRAALADAKKHFECKVKVDDGNGGTGWKFFESRQDAELWKRQK
jgi:hypothetical protein